MNRVLWRHILQLASMDAVLNCQPDPKLSLAGALPSDPVSLLAEVVSVDERVSLQLSRLTHGGQVWLPGTGSITPPYLGHKQD